MAVQTNIRGVNPLAGLMRQPKIYIKLPSGGQYWPQGSIVIPENGDLPVYSMTAKDELLLKIPDALMNGQAIVEVIQNCIPSIKNGWAIPNIDLDVILIAIRIATYGEKMKVPLDNKNLLDVDYEVDLRNIMADLVGQINWDPVVPVNADLTIFVKPITYKLITDGAMQSFETQKIIQIANNSDLEEKEKVKMFKESFDKLNLLSIGIVNNSVYEIQSSQGSTKDPAYIKEFMENVDKGVFDAVKAHLEKMKDQNTIKPLQIQPTAAMLAAGYADEIIEVPLVFDASTFFV